MSTSSAMEYPQTIQIDAGDDLDALAFTANGEYLVGGGYTGVYAWRVKDGERVATMQAKDVWSIAVSKNGRFIAAGSQRGDVWVWDGTYKQVFAEKIPGEPYILGIDFSPDSTRLVSAEWDTCTATVWDIAARKKVQTLDHDRPVGAAKYSPEGDRIATATLESIRVYSNDGQLLVGVRVEMKMLHSLLWFNNHLFVQTRDSEIKQIDASTGSTISEWPVPYDDRSRIALPQHGKFIAYSTGDNITFWDTSTHTQLGLIPRSSGPRLIAFSPTDRLFASVSPEKKIIIKDLSLIGGHEIHIDDAALDAWKNGQLSNAEALLTTATPRSHHVLASRALVRARLQQWDAALVDAEESIEMQSSVIGYIAKSVALAGKGDTDAACRVCDMASLLFHSDHVVILVIKAVVLFMAGEHGDAISRIGDLISVRSLDPTLYVVKAYMLLLLGDLHAENGDYNCAIQSFEDARLRLGNSKEQLPLTITLISGWKFDDLAIMIQQRLSESLLSAGRVKEAGECVLRIVGREANMAESLKTWVYDFVRRCLSTPEKDDNVIFGTPTGHDNVLHPMVPLSREWARSTLTTGSWRDALIAATGLTLPRFTIYQVICEHLETINHVADAVACLHQMCSELAQEIYGERANWIGDFKSRCGGKLEHIGDIAVNNQEYDKAISQYTIALSLEPASMQELLVKRSMVRVSKREWENALKDADEVIRLDPDSPLGYERRHAALHCKGDYEEAIIAYETMLSKISESTDPEIREQSCRYLTPEVKKTTIRTTIKDIIQDSPLVLIDTIHGRLCDKSEQASAFEKTPKFTELISFMTTHIDHSYIEQGVGEYFRYVTFSHKWEENEPLFEKVMKVLVYDLEASPAHEKLQMFCKLVREAGFNWAWSDTCCINKGDHFVLQEALVSMFKWYERAAMTLIFLRGVDRKAKRGALTRNIWNMRAWTLQEYHASKVVQIYTEDWTPYLGLELYNHRDAPEVISEMEEATGISAQALMSLRPGLANIREKLRLASTRQSTRIEDAAYSLLGIFSLSLPITYGEGDRALGRLLSQLLASSGDTSILAWSGRSGRFNSCLPSSITVFSQLPTSHIPPAISDTEMGSITARLGSFNLTLLATLYDKVNVLPVPSFSGLRMKLPCLVFEVGRVLVSKNESGRVFRAQTNALGIVEIQSQEDLSRLGPLCLVHPWIDFLLDRQPVGSAAETITEEHTDNKSSVLGESPLSPQTTWFSSLIGRSSNGRSTIDTALPQPPSTLSAAEKRIRVLRFIARLRQPFGALLLAPTRRNIDEYRRVAAESLITVQVEEVTPAILDKLVECVRTLDVL